MIRFAIIIAALLVASPCLADCPGGVCRKPIRSIVTKRGESHLPRVQAALQPRAATCSGRRCHGRRLFGHGLFPRLRFAP